MKLTEWQPEDEVVTNYRTIVQSQQEAYTQGWKDATVSKHEFTEDQFDEQVDLLYSHIDKFVDDDSEGFSMDLIEYSSMAYLTGWSRAINMVLDVCSEMYNGFDPATLQELEQRIV